MYNIFDRASNIRLQIVWELEVVAISHGEAVEISSMIGYGGGLLIVKFNEIHPVEM